MMHDDPPSIGKVPAAHLEGRDLGNGWIVGERVHQGPEASGGHFSICYIAVHTDGRRAFLKALNFQAAEAGPGSIVDQLNHFTSAYIFERDLLADCRDQRMSRVIRLIEHGQAHVPEAGGLLTQVPYLILESAEGDIGAFRARSTALDCAWGLRVMKHVLEGLEQLHGVQAAHQDLRPSNVLTLADGQEMKLGDLGRAERRSAVGPWSELSIPGARTYAPPEQQYGAFAGTWEERRAADLYLAGSLGAQLFLGHCMSAMLQEALVPQFRLTYWEGSFQEVLPHLMSAHAQVIPELEDATARLGGNSDLANQFATAIEEMTHPDPAQRGHPRDRAARTSSYATRRYVSLMNLLAAEMGYYRNRKVRE